MKIDFFYQQLFFGMYNAIYMDHVDCSFFLYETLRSKLNLFIQISLNATPPQKKPGSTYLCYVLIIRIMIYRLCLHTSHAWRMNLCFVNKVVL